MAHPLNESEEQVRRTKEKNNRGTQSTDDSRIDTSGKTIKRKPVSVNPFDQYQFPTYLHIYEFNKKAVLSCKVRLSKQPSMHCA
jgi:hypothetical protein